jgi:tRNA pseudouridine13 synthase
MPVDLAPRALPLLTTALPGTGGLAKVAPEDFLVEEIPAYAASGAGDHLYLWVEKRDVSTADAARILAKALGIPEREIGYAGQKDRRAITRQWFSALTKANEVTLDDPRLRVVAASRHGNKLRLGHLRGNRFTLVLRGTSPDAEARAANILAELSRRGLPNFYGEQRFGRRGDNALLGAALLGLADHPEKQRASRDRHLRRLALSALQSELFNRWLAARMADGLYERVIVGDVLKKREGGPFVCTDPAADQPRLEALELDVTGPMTGHKERPAAQADALAREDRILAEAGVPRDAFASAAGEAEGARRPARVPVDDPRVRALGADAIELSFGLPAGSYATRVIAEVTKADIALPSEG